MDFLLFLETFNSRSPRKEKTDCGCLATMNLS
jgi:hypothetical protein